VKSEQLKLLAIPAAVLVVLIILAYSRGGMGGGQPEEAGAKSPSDIKYEIEKGGGDKIFDGDAVLYSLTLLDEEGVVVKEGRGWQLVRKMVEPVRNLVKKLGVGGEGEFVAPYEKYIPGGGRSFLEQGKPVRARVRVEKKIHEKFLIPSDGRQVGLLAIDVGGRGGVDVLGGGDWKKKGRSEKWMNSRNCRRFSADGDSETLWEWIGPSTGLLVVESPELLQRSESKIGGYIPSGADLVGSFTGGQQWQGSYQMLEQFDENKNGVVDGGELERLGFWVDGNINARVEDGEVRGAEEVFTEISASPEERAEGSDCSPRAGAVLKDGKRIGSWEWWTRGRTADK
jgi:hypothetical protein